MISPRQYAQSRGILLRSVYEKLWSGRLAAEKKDGRWLILDEPDQPATWAPARRSGRAVNADVTGA